MIYLDTSALLKLYIRESGSNEVQKVLSSQSEPLPLWEIQEMELRNALRLKVFWDDISQSDSDHQLELLEERKLKGQYVYPRFDRVSLFNRVRTLTDLTPKTGCRTMDILHVACAIEIQAELFVSYDLRQIKLAKQARLKVFSGARDPT